MAEVFAGFVFLVWAIGVAYLLSQQGKPQQNPKEPKPKTPQEFKQDTTTMNPLKQMNRDFVPMLDRAVPTHASQSNKFNDIIGNETSGIVGPAAPQVVIPSDQQLNTQLPTEFDGAYWPRGTIEPDYLQPGSDPKRPLRSQLWPAAQSRVKGD